MSNINLKAEIHDLGYARYTGPRLPASSRWRVIMRHQLTFAWRTWWRYKLSLILAVIATVVFGTLIYVLRSETVSEFDRAGITLRFVDLMLLIGMGVFVKIAFILSMTLTAFTIANDERTGALIFYFVRSTRPRDYVLGRFAGLFLLNAPILIIGPLLLVLLRVGLADTGESTFDNLVLIPKVILVGTLATASFAAVPLAFSAINKNQWMTFGLWAAWYIVGGNIIAAVALFVSGGVGALDLQLATTQGLMKLLEIAPMIGKHGEQMVPDLVPLAAALISLTLQPVIALGLAMFKLHRSQRDVGGGS